MGALEGPEAPLACWSSRTKSYARWRRMALTLRDCVEQGTSALWIVEDDRPTKAIACMEVKSAATASLQGSLSTRRVQRYICVDVCERLAGRDAHYKSPGLE
jgi:hypothetical protein